MTGRNLSKLSANDAALQRELVIVSGYYGFDNLGDEAILEEVTNELKRLVDPQNIVILSATPDRTAELFGVRSHDRMDVLGFATLCKQARLFISGGGGLFQNTRSLGSILFYSWQMLVAKSSGAKVTVYAQGIGPLRGSVAQWITKRSFMLADAIAIRDNGSKQMLDDWSIQANQTADPVWCLEQRKLPDDVDQALSAIKARYLVGLSLRPSHNFSDNHMQSLIEAMLVAVPESSHVVLLPLQNAQDLAPLEQFGELWKQSGRESTLINTAALRYPAQWISLFARCKILVGMRLHALIMSLKSGVPVVGIAYDPKVSHLLAEFEQPSLILTKEPQQNEWQQTMKAAFEDTDKLSRRAMRKAEGAKKLACQNFDMLARILNTQKHS